jgi:hypothetical protein
MKKQSKPENVEAFDTHTLNQGKIAISSNPIVGKTYAESKEGTPPTLPVARGAPNILWILLDDVGFGASSAFGGQVRTPVIENLANNGLRYTNSHTTSVCSPSHAASWDVGWHCPDSYVIDTVWRAANYRSRADLDERWPGLDFIHSGRNTLLVFYYTYGACGWRFWHWQPRPNPGGALYPHQLT